MIVTFAWIFSNSIAIILYKPLSLLILPGYYKPLSLLIIRVAIASYSASGVIIIHRILMIILCIPMRSTGLLGARKIVSMDINPSIPVRGP